MKTINKILIVGLGNNGDKYKNTPHNVGFDIIDELIARIKNQELTIKQMDEKYADIFEWQNGNKKIIAAKTKIFMNESGIAVKSLRSKFKVQSSKLCLVHDDIDLLLGQIKVQFDRSSAGHKGVQNVIDKLGTQKFYRCRIGVRPRRAPATRTHEWMNAFVTKKISGENQKTYNQSINKAVQLLRKAAENSINDVLGNHAL